MRINKFLAANTLLSRRSADTAINEGKIMINGHKAKPGDDVGPNDTVTLENLVVSPRKNYKPTVLLLNKPVGYVCSRNGQGSSTIYELIPDKYRHLNSVGRLDKDSSGILIMTDDGQLANKLTHPSFEKEKKYIVKLDHDLDENAFEKIAKGIAVEDYVSRMKVTKTSSPTIYQILLSEGKNRQIRKSFTCLGYKVISLHRVQMGIYDLGDIKPGEYKLTSLQ